MRATLSKSWLIDLCNNKDYLSLTISLFLSTTNGSIFIYVMFLLAMDRLSIKHQSSVEPETARCNEHVMLTFLARQRSVNRAKDACYHDLTAKTSK